MQLFRDYAERCMSERFLKFVIVGLINTLVDFIFFSISIALLPAYTMGITIIFAKAIGFVAASTNSYYLNSYWTFRASSKLGIKNYTAFLMVSCVGFLINVSAVYSIYTLILKVVPTQQIFAPYVGFLCATFCSLWWNYYGYKKFVFKI